MSVKKYSVKKYIVSTTLVTAFVFSPMLASSALASGSPDMESQNNTNNSPATEEVQQSESTSVKSSNITKGDRGESVKSVQTSLKNKGQSIQSDGVFGQNTDNAVKNFQESNGLGVDGIVGPATKEALSIEATTETETSTTESTNESTSSTSESTKESTNESTNTTESEDLTIAESDSSSSASQSDVVSVAKSLVGTPYTPGGTTTAGFDSSGFINYVFDKADVSLSRTHAGMWSNNGTHINSPSVGDVVFFENTYKGGVSHSGIYLGNNQMVHAGTEQTGVEITTMSYDYWQDRYIGAKSF